MAAIEGNQILHLPFLRPFVEHPNPRQRVWLGLESPRCEIQFMVVEFNPQNRGPLTASSRMASATPFSTGALRPPPGPRTPCDENRRHQERRQKCFHADKAWQWLYYELYGHHPPPPLESSKVVPNSHILEGTQATLFFGYFSVNSEVLVKKNI